MSSEGPLGSPTTPKIIESILQGTEADTTLTEEPLSTLVPSEPESAQPRESSQVNSDNVPAWGHRKPTGHSRTGSKPSRRSSYSGNYPSQPNSPTKPLRSPTHPTLKATTQDLQKLIKALSNLIPFSTPTTFLRSLFRPLVHILAKLLHSRGMLAGDLIYDIVVLIFKWIINLFFRELRPRGAHNIPKSGPVIFVAAPHANQFLDPLLLASEVRLSAGRRVAFLAAEASLKRKFIGFAASLLQSISTRRAADEAKPGQGTIYVKESQGKQIIKGHNTSWKAIFKPKMQVQLSKTFGSTSFEIESVVDDTTLKLKKPINDSIWEKLVNLGEDGTNYKILPYIDQRQMYAKVYKKLSDGGCIGIFPEGGSHDRTDLLPLKAGVALMALGAMAENASCQVQIVPVGLSYFHPHRFRSRAVIEFGSPILIPSDLVQLFSKGGDAKRQATGKVLDLIFDALKSVTLQAPDYETLMVVQAVRRLYRPPGQQLSLGAVVELNRRFITGYLKYKDEPKVQKLKYQVLAYNHLLRLMGMRDHQVERANRPAWKSLGLLLYRATILTGWSLLALPGLILNAPMFIAASYISHQKAKEALAKSSVKIQGRDVLATWKILVSLGMAPPVYTIYAIITTYLAYKYNLERKYKIWMPLITFVVVNAAGYSALKFGEVGMDVYKSLRPLMISLLPGNEKSIEELREMRKTLTVQLAEVVDEFGPKTFEDFESFRLIPSSATPAPQSDAPSRLRRRKSGQTEQGLLSHPFEWLDDTLFGWSKSYKPSKLVKDEDSPTSSGYNSSQEEEDADYEEVIGFVQRPNGTVTELSGDSQSNSSNRLRKGNSKSRSGLDLSKLEQKKEL